MKSSAFIGDCCVYTIWWTICYFELSFLFTCFAFLLSLDACGLFGPLFYWNLILAPSDLASCLYTNCCFWAWWFSELKCMQRPLSPTGCDILRFLRPTASLFCLLPRLENGLSYISVFARLTNLSSKIFEMSFFSLICTPEMLLCYNFMLIRV